MGVLYTRDTDGALTPVNAIRVVTEENRNGLDATIYEFSQMNDLVTAYLAAADAAYTDDNGDFVSVIANYETAAGNADRPVGYPLSITGYGTTYLQYEGREEGGGEGWSLQAKGGDSVRGYVLNAIPGKISQYLVKTETGGTLLENGRIKPTGKVRMIRFMGNHRNCRDLGGWACDGGTVKYGKLFRSAATVYLEEWIDPIIAKNIGFRHHIDFRSDAEANNITVSPLGSEIRYQRIPITNYYADSVALDGTDLGNLKKIFRVVFDAAVHDEGVLYNCSLGRDRTGTVTFMLLALLGVAKSDIDKDYELTSFSGTYYPDMTSAYRTGAAYQSLGTYLTSFGGTTLRDNVVWWFIYAGFSLAELNAFRAAMIDGTPDELTSEQFTKTYNLTQNLINCTSNTTSESIAENTGLSVTITPDSGYKMESIVVTMGGTDITADYLSGSVITIPAVTGDVVITATAVELATFALTQTLTNCTSNIANKTVREGDSLSVTITPVLDHEISEIVVTMGGSTVPASMINGNVITIPVVTGDVVITATATEIVTSYTNLVRSATTEPYGEEIYNGYGFCNGKYLSGVTTVSYSDDADCVATGSIPVKVTNHYFPTIYIKGITIDVAANSHCRFYFTKADGTVQTTNLFATTDVSKYSYALTKLGDMYYKFEPTANDDGTYDVANVSGTGNISFRISGIGTGENLIVTIDEPIE